MTAIVPTTPLWALAPEYAAVLAEVMEAEGDITDEDLAARLDAIQVAFSEKVEKCQMVYRHMNGDAESCRAFVEAAMKPYMDRAKKLAAMADRVKRYVQSCMEAAQTERVETPLGGARLQKNPPSVLYEGDPATLPEPFRRVTYELDAKAVIEAAKAKQPIPEGAKVINDRKHLRWL
jgi:hypothetical protein